MKYALAGVLSTIMFLTVAIDAKGEDVVCGKRFVTFETPNQGFMFPASFVTVFKDNVIRMLLNAEDEDAFAVMTVKGDPGSEHGIGTMKLKNHETWQQVIACLN